MNPTTRVVTFGEVMLRLKSPGFERLFQSPSLEASFGGAEANVAVSLAQFGVPVSFEAHTPGSPCKIVVLMGPPLLPASVTGI